MKLITLGKTGITTPQNAFGALPIQRVEKSEAVRILRKAAEGGITFFDTARSYSDSEEKLGEAFQGIRKDIILASKSHAKNGIELKSDLETTLRNLRTDHLDLYQLHCAPSCFSPDDGTGLYEALSEAKQAGKVLHIGITTHKLDVAEEAVQSGLYETLQFPFSYLASERDISLVRSCAEAGMGFIAMKGLSGGLLTNAEACMAFMQQYPVLPIWGIQRESELDQWLAFFKHDAVMTDSLKDLIEHDRAGLLGDFCRGCGYCAPCTAGIQINQCARMSQMIRRSPSAGFLSPYWQEEMEKISQCIRCGACLRRCPYELNIPDLLRKNLEDYRKIVAGEIQI